MSFLNFIKKYYLATNEVFLENKGRYRLTRRERKIFIFIIYILMILLLPILFIFFKQTAKILLPVFLILYIFIEFVVNFNIFKILIIFFVYEKNNSLINLFKMVYFEKKSDLLLRSFQGTIKQLSLSKDYFNICKIKVFGFLDKVNILLIFKKNKVVICYNGNKKIIKNFPSDENQLLSNLVEEIKLLNTV